MDLGRGTRARMAGAAGLAVALVVTLGLATPAGAQEQTDDEGGTATLRAQLEAATRGFVDAKRELAASQQRQKQLAAQLKTVEAQLVERTAVVGELAGVAYRGGRVSMVSALLDSDSPDALVDRVAALDSVAANQTVALRALVKTRGQVTRGRAAIAAEIKQQEKQVAVMAARKKQAENALAAAGRGGGAADAPGGGGGGGGTARPAPRNPDGSFPGESCSVNDPTTDGCLTPRMLHAYNQARAAGFTRFTRCKRSGGSGEHPLGRACDFSAEAGGFGGVAAGGDRRYGDNLANYLVNNADRLAVMYVIWFRRIWLPSSGWRAYTSGNGDPSSEHENHVHLSVF